MDFFSAQMRLGGWPWALAALSWPCRLSRTRTLQLLRVSRPCSHQALLQSAQATQLRLGTLGWGSDQPLALPIPASFLSFL